MRVNLRENARSFYLCPDLSFVVPALAGTKEEGALGLSQGFNPWVRYY